VSAGQAARSRLDGLGAALVDLAEHPDRARAAIDQIASSGDPLARAVARHLAGSGRNRSYVGPYVDPEGFRRFITGGGNVALYQATSAALASRYPAGDFALLDLGTGDGRAAVPALEAHRGKVEVDAVEPSEELRRGLAEAVAGSSHGWRLHGQTAEEFVTAGRGRWDVAQSTFALHNLPPAELDRLLRALRPRVGRLVVVEFDVPRFTGQRDPARVAYCVERYRAGIAEYPGDALVVDGFLVPVLLGGLDPSVPQTTYEQPAADWSESLSAAGFDSVTVEPVAPYWWAPAVVITGG
jgi:hypothetical protein